MYKSTPQAQTESGHPCTSSGDRCNFQDQERRRCSVLCLYAAANAEDVLCAGFAHASRDAAGLLRPSSAKQAHSAPKPAVVDGLDDLDQSQRRDTLSSNAPADSDSDAFALFEDLALPVHDAEQKTHRARSESITEQRAGDASASSAQDAASAMPASAQPASRPAERTARPGRPPLAVSRQVAVAEPAPPSYDDIMGASGTAADTSDSSPSPQASYVRSVFIHIGEAAARTAQHFQPRRADVQNVDASEQPAASARRMPRAVAQEPAQAASVSTSPERADHTTDGRQSAPRASRREAQSSPPPNLLDRSDLHAHGRSPTTAGTASDAHAQTRAQADAAGATFFSLDDDEQTVAATAHSTAAVPAVDRSSDLRKVSAQVADASMPSVSYSPEPVDLLGDAADTREEAAPWTGSNNGVAQVDDLDDFFQAGASASQAEAAQADPDPDDFFGTASNSARNAPAQRSSAPRAAAVGGDDLIGGMGDGSGVEAGDEQLERTIGEAHDACAHLSAERAHKLREAVSGARAYVDKRMVRLTCATSSVLV